VLVPGRHQPITDITVRSVTPSRRSTVAGGGQRTLRRRLLAVPARLVAHVGALTLRLPPGEHLLAQVLARIRALPTPS
jgi:hypothetical protein